MTHAMNFCIRCGAPLPLGSLAREPAVRRFTRLLALVAYILAYFTGVTYLVFWLAN